MDDHLKTNGHGQLNALDVSMLLEIDEEDEEVVQNLRNSLLGALSGKSIPEVYSVQELFDFLQHTCLQVRWLAVHAIGFVLKLTESEKAILIQRNGIKSEEEELFETYFHSTFGLSLLSNIRDESKTACTKTALPSNGLRNYDIVSANDVVNSTFMIVESKQKNIDRVHQLLVSELWKPVCILGTTGVGKTTMIRLAAAMANRFSYPHIIFVQLSDQIDARLLLGSYHSTDLPGQFVWKPGCLTKAVLNGYWVVLEDLDTAPADVLTLLDSIIDSGSLSVPGYGEIKHFHKDFRIIGTIRKFSEGSSKKTDGMLGNRWIKIEIDDYSQKEMKLMLASLYPHLKTVAGKLASVFDVMQESNQKRGLKNRLLSLRDFLKLCNRIPANLDLTKSASSVKVFQESLDLFVANFFDSPMRKEVAEKLGAHFNITPATVDHFLSTYKPTLSIDLNKRLVTAGRFTLPMFTTKLPLLHAGNPSTPVYSLTKSACRFLEMVCGCVQQGEPVLLLGETGVGKTSSIQFLAQVLRQKLIVVNLNRQSDSADLLGGYKPVELKHVFLPVREEFETLFELTFKRETNVKFLNHIMTTFANKEWKVLLHLMMHVQKSALQKKRILADKQDVVERWREFGHQLSRIDCQLRLGPENPFAFTFIEGSLIEAIRKGQWILLDEINLATPEMLQCLGGALEAAGIVNLWEKGDESPVKKHKDFRLFAAMNPSTDVGKRDLPMGLRNRFTEFFVEELLDPDELQVLVGEYLREMSLMVNQITSIVEFYLSTRRRAITELTDGTGKRPHFSLRTLCRGLQIASRNLYGSVSRSLYESFCISFLTQLDHASHSKVQASIARHIFPNQNSKAIISQALPKPNHGNFVCVEGYWIPMGDQQSVTECKYILTPSVRRNLKDIARIVSAGQLPVLIQGETSVGKTSLIQYLAQLSGNRCYRINNHQHTDLQEYLGSYQSDESGRLIFVEGLLVQAMRRGEWIILDELNLAPSEVLEALNRLLDDNRQLFISETGVTVTAHPRFTLFATQNPPGLYGGRKLLSRAFRNRFVELHFDEIPSSELETILHLRCDIPPSYCKKIIGTLKELQMRRKSSAALQGKHGFATLRDLFRWAERYRLSDVVTGTFYDWDQHLADEGYLVLAGKVRESTEAEVIIDALKKYFKRTVNPENLFSLHENTSKVTQAILQKAMEFSSSSHKHVVWTYTMRRLAVLIGNSMKFNEPILLVGETGCGKTTMVQILSEMFSRKLYSVNCHMNSEGSDFLGGLRPIRNRQSGDDRLFEWVNGPLVEAMISGGVFLADEISLADDSVLERINSVLEKERTLLISEKGGETPETIVAHESFVFVGTMNPGGDYGKKELSPALRNRLTEIWCPVFSNDREVEEIVEHNLSSDLKERGIGALMTAFCKWLKEQDLCRKVVISLRDFLSWTQFINARHESGDLAVSGAIVHGACLVFLDAMGSGTTCSESPAVWNALKESSAKKLETLIQGLKLSEDQQKFTDWCLLGNVDGIRIIDDEDMLQIGDFQIAKESFYGQNYLHFTLEAPTTCRNALRIVRAMQLNKPILLEGSPGVGKTAIVAALANCTNNAVIRINLSDQTDISDLFGADLPIEGETGGRFAWRDGPLLQALKNSSWILLDELNLASQSVLEGLNACLDHRGEIYVPELNRTFHVPAKSCRIFACQNPVRQGGARKGLPKSFLNRFTQVYVDSLELADLRFIIHNLYPQIPPDYVALMTRFSQDLHEEVCIQLKFGARGSPWDFNLRDVLRWCCLMVKNKDEENAIIMDDQVLDLDCTPPGVFVDYIYGMRMRSQEDRAKVLQLFENIDNEVDPIIYKGNLAVPCGQAELTITEDQLICGNAKLPRKSEIYDTVDYAWRKKLSPLPHQLSALEATMKCLQMGWMPILVGSASSGKSSLVKLISQLCGKDLHVMCPSPEMDTMELLGSFEQADIYRRIDDVTRHLDQLMNGLLKLIVVYHELPSRTEDPSEMDKDEFYDFSKEWMDFTKSRPLRPRDGLGKDEELARIAARTKDLESVYSKCKSMLERVRTIYSSSQPVGSIPPSSSTMERVNDSSEEVKKELEDIQKHLRAGIQTGSFHWIHSLLIKAMIKGDWLLIDGANRCSSAVLDRLNSLVEPNGSLFLTERGAIDGEIIEIRPHSEFRLILTMNPAYGEISRAMRNRGIEIYLPGLDEHKSWIDTSTRTSRNSREIALSDVMPLSPESFLNSKSYRIWKRLSVFQALHARLDGLQDPYDAAEQHQMLLLTTFWRCLPQDLTELTELLVTRFPTAKALIHKMGAVKVSTTDLQFEPGFVGQYKNRAHLPPTLVSELLATCLHVLHLHDISVCEDNSIVEKGSIAFTARNIANGRGAVPTELEDALMVFRTYWRSQRNLEDILQIIFSYKSSEVRQENSKIVLTSSRNDSMEIDSGESYSQGFSLDTMAAIWLQGLRSVMLMKKLTTVGSTTFCPSQNNELLFAEIRLLLESLRTNTVPWLKLIVCDDSDYADLMKELKIVLKSLSFERGRSEDSIMFEKLFREVALSSNALKISRENQENVLEFLKSVFSIWSYKSVIPQDNWPAVLKKSQTSYQYIVTGCQAIFEGQVLQADSKEALQSFLSVNRLEIMNEEVSKEEDRLTVVTSNLAALEEYLRLTSDGTEGQSYFANPILTFLKTQPSTNGFGRIRKYLAWEEQIRFYNVFAPESPGLPGMDFLLPMFSSRIFTGSYTGNNSDYWLPNLAESSQYKEAFVQLSKAISLQIFTPRPTDMSHAANRLKADFLRDIKIVTDVMEQAGIQNSPVQFKLLAIREGLEALSNPDLEVMGEAMVQAGAILLEVLAYLPPVDPAVESEVLGNFCEQDIQYFTNWIDVQEDFDLALIGKNISGELQHPFRAAVRNHISVLKQSMEEYHRADADRPVKPHYSSILKDVLSFMASIGAKEKVNALLDEIKRLFVAETMLPSTSGCAKSIEKLEELCRACDHWIAAHLNFADKLSRYFMYWDVIAPLLSISCWSSIGVSVLKHVMLTKFHAPKSHELESIRAMVQFPGESNETTVTSYLYNLPANQSTKLFLSSMLCILNLVIKKQALSAEVVEKLYALSSAVAKTWIAQKEKAQQEEAEKDALYIFKGKERLLEASAEELDAQEMKESFPDFRKDFQDLIPCNTLDGDRPIVSSLETENEVDPQQNDGVHVFKDHDVKLFVKAQFQMLDFVQEHFLEPRKCGEAIDVDVITPFMQRFIIGCQAYNGVYRRLSCAENLHFAIGTYVASTQCQMYPEKSYAKLLKSSSLEGKTIYDIYHDPNPQEVQSLIPMLENLRSRVSELLEEWPEFPSLMRILTVINRLESFQADDPIAKYLTGVELLVETAQEWENNAHKGVSMAAQLIEFFQIIIKWRKMELSCWKNLLEITQRREEDKALEWWFYMVGVLEEFAKTDADAEKVADFRRCLQQFMESSTLGQFETRLQILSKAFRMFLAWDKYLAIPTQIPTTLYSVLWNTIQYFREFLPAVKQKISSLRQPIEKKLKDFVKICRWNDMNLSALKDSIASSQKILMRSMRELKQILSTPAKTLMATDDRPPLKLKVITLEEHHWKLFMGEAEETNMIINPACTVKAAFGENFNSEPVLGALTVPKLLSKIKTIRNASVQKSSTHFKTYHSQIQELSESILETFSEMQAFETSEKGDARKKILHHVHSRRRLAVADLFKDLANAGLSYRRGLVKLRSQDSNISAYLYDFLNRPHDLLHSWNVLKDSEMDSARREADSLLAQSWQSVDSCFQQCIIRMLSSMSAFESPNKQITPAIIDRCRGFLVDLLNSIVIEKREIADLSNSLWNLRSKFLVLDQNFNVTSLWKLVESTRESIASIVLSLEQWRVVTQDTNASASLQNTVCEVLELAATILEKTSTWTEYRLRVDDIESLRSWLEPLMEQLNIPVNEDSSIVERQIGASLDNFKHHLAQLQTKLSTKDKSTLEQSGIGTTIQPLSEIVTKVMLVVQRLAGHYALETDCAKPFEILPIIRYMETSSVLDRVKHICEGPYDERSKNLKYVLSPYLDLCQFYLTELIHVHRDHCQLFLAMTSLFTSLGQKGFNLPPDYEEEAMQEGSELDAKGGLGLGEGETTSDAKDVSDRIESEDQLEETLQQGETVDSADKDVEEDDGGIDMTENFEGKQQDKKQSEKEGEDSNDEDNNAEDENEDMEKEMGDVGEPDAEKLDEQLWGGSSDEEEEMEENEDNVGGQKLQGQEPELKSKENNTTQDEEENLPNDKEQQKQKETKEPDSDSELNDDQIDPIHGQEVPETEPEPLDLPEDLNLDDDTEMNDKEQEEENPFDLDAEKDSREMSPEDNKDQLDEDETAEVENEIRETPKEGQDEAEEAEEMQIEPPDVPEQNSVHDEPEKLPEDPQEEEQVAKPEDQILDKSKAKDTEENVEADPQNQAQPDSNAENQLGAEENIENATTVEEQDPRQQNDNNKGQAEASTGPGHEGKTASKTQQDSSSTDEKQQSSNNSAENDRKRTLAAEQEEPSAKRLKALESKEVDDDSTAENDDAVDQSDNQFDLYQHVSNAENFDSITVDNASKEDAVQQNLRDEQEDQPMESDSESKHDDSDVELLEDDKLPADKTKQPSEKQPKSRKEAPDDMDKTDQHQEVSVEGEVTATYAVSRPDTSYFVTQHELAKRNGNDVPIATEDQEDEIVTIHGVDRVPNSALGEHLAQWHQLESETLPLAQDLCEQLRLILEPTLAARLKGDYKTGKRLNMRKVIPYVASGFRKDKIWLRRTQPSKREYQILLALDDSASMSDNQSKQMAFSAVAVVAKALGLLEAGELGVASFGEDVKMVHSFDEPFTDTAGAQLLQKFTFNQRLTRVGQLMSYVTQTFKDLKNRSHTSSNLNADLAQLVLIISDGRNVASEGKDCVTRAIKKARDENIFIVFIIVDNPKNRDSILDIRYAEFDDKNNLKQFNYYMDHFPFPFYMILRDLNTLPSVLTNALRQWFELVTSGD